jgi:Polysaccharide deacetylase
VLTLHRIGTGRGLTLAMTREALESRVQTLLDAGYTFITLDAPIVSTNEKLAAITFDDGYQDVYSQAFPVLQKMSVPATSFVITSVIDTPGFMTWTQLQELQDAGWSIGSHTLNHADLKMLTPESINREIHDAQQVLQNHGLSSSACLAYPFGSHDSRVRDIAADYHPCAFATGAGINNSLQDPMSYNRPLLLPFGVAWQAQGNDARAMLFAESLVYWLIPGSSETTVPRAFYHPARFELLGNFEFQTSYQTGKLSQDFFYREGSFAVTSHVSRIGGNYTEVSGVWSQDNFAVGVGWSSYGPVLGIAAPLFGYGEAWLKLGTYNNSAIGVSLIPFDYFLLKSEVSLLGGFNAEATYALPLFTDQGRPLRVLAGFDETFYGGLNAHLGSFETRMTISTDAQLNFGFGSSW